MQAEALVHVLQKTLSRLILKTTAYRIRKVATLGMEWGSAGSHA